MTNSRLTCMAAGVVAALTLSGCGAGNAVDGTQGEDVLRLALNQSEDHPSYVALEGFAEFLDESEEDLSLDVYPNEVLGAQAEVMQLVGEGVVDMAVVSGAQLENVNDDFIAFNVPRVFDDIDHQMDVVQDPAITGDLYSSLESSNGFTVLGGLTQGTRSIYTSFGAVETPEDMAGAKLRVQESDLNIAVADALGASATPMSFGELYTGLQAGVVDAAENNEVSYFTQSHYEVAPHWSMTEHLIGLDYVLINAERFDEMTAAQREVFLDGWELAWQEHTDLWTDDTEEAIEAAKADGAEFHEVDHEAFAEPLDAVAEDFITTDTQRELYEAAREEAP